MNCKLVLSLRSQFFHNRRFFSSQAKLRSTVHAGISGGGGEAGRGKGSVGGCGGETAVCAEEQPG